MTKSRVFNGKKYYRRCRFSKSNTTRSYAQQATMGYRKQYGGARLVETKNDWNVYILAMMVNGSYRDTRERRIEQQ